MENWTKEELIAVVKKLRDKNLEASNEIEQYKDKILELENHVEFMRLYYR